jgi:hypothetical protein
VLKVVTRLDAGSTGVYPRAVVTSDEVRVTAPERVLNVETYDPRTSVTSACVSVTAPVRVLNPVTPELVTVIDFVAEVNAIVIPAPFANRIVSWFAVAAN